MNWSEKYKISKIKGMKDTSNLDISSEELFDIYIKQLSILYEELQNIISGTVIQSKFSKVLISKSKHEMPISDKEKVDLCIFSDNDNELKIIPEGIHFIGVYGRVVLKAYRKAYSFNSLIEKKIQAIKEPYLLLIKDSSVDNTYTWGYIKEEDNVVFGREVKKINQYILESIFDDVFLNH